MGVAVCVYALPFAISAALMGSNIGPSTVVRENIIRFFEPFDHRGRFYLYTYAIFELMAPWCLFLPAALIAIHAKPEGRNDRFVLAYFWATFVFTLSGSRRDYYLLPILPAAAIIVARFQRALESLDRPLVLADERGLLSSGIFGGGVGCDQRNWFVRPGGASRTFH